MEFEIGDNRDYFDRMREYGNDRNRFEQMTEEENRNRSDDQDRLRADRNGNRLCRGLIHIVKEGETLYKIAQMYHVDVSELMYENPYVNIYQLQPGDEICVPVAERI